MTNIIDPIDGLIRYVNEIKPYHSKIIEVLTEYTLRDSINVTITESLLLGTGIVVSPVSIDALNAGTRFLGTYGVGPYDASEYWPVISLNPTLAGGAFHVELDVDGDLIEEYLGYNPIDNTFSIPDDQTSIFRAGRQITVTLNRVNTVLVDSNNAPLRTLESETSLLIGSSEFITAGQINGIANNPHTLVTMDIATDLDNFITKILDENEVWEARVEITPISVDSVVVGFGSENIGNGDFANSILLIGDIASAYPFGTPITLMLQDGTQIRNLVANVFYDASIDRTVVRLLESLDLPAASYANAVLIETFTGKDIATIAPNANVANGDTEGLLDTIIVENLSFNFGSGANGAQYFIKAITNNNTIEVNGIATDRISVTDEITILGSEDISNNGIHIVTGITITGQNTEITVSSTLVNVTGPGWVETI